jgi:Amt family ammonium transporter
MMLIYVGIFGLNGGEAYETTDGVAGMAILNTMIASGVSSLSWTLTETFYTGQTPTSISALNGAMAGLITVSAGAGYIDPTGGFFYGLLGGAVGFFVTTIRKRFGVIYALDVFGMQTFSAVLGAILNGFFVSSAICNNPDAYVSCPILPNGILYQDGADASGYTVRARLLGIQLYGIVVTVGWAILISGLIAKIIDLTLGLKAVDSDVFEKIEEEVEEIVEDIEKFAEKCVPKC